MSLVGAGSVVVPIPYLVVLLGLSAAPGFSPLPLAIAAGLGSAAGELVAYGVGHLGGRAVRGKYRRRLRAVRALLERFGPWAVFIFGLTPLPDDLLFIPLGLMHYSFLRVFIPCILGKFLMAVIITHVGAVVGKFYLESPYLGIATGVLLVAVVIALLAVDWEKKLRTFVEGRG